MDKQVTSTPNTWKFGGGGGGSGYLNLHYWPPLDWEPAINVDMVNSLKARMVAKKFDYSLFIIFFFNSLKNRIIHYF